MGLVLVHNGQPRHAARLLGAGQRIRAANGLTPDKQDTDNYNTTREKLLETLSVTEAEQLMHSVGDISLEQSIALAQTISRRNRAAPCRISPVHYRPTSAQQYTDTDGYLRRHNRRPADRSSPGRLSDPIIQSTAPCSDIRAHSSRQGGRPDQHSMGARESPVSPTDAHIRHLGHSRPAARRRGAILA